MKKVKIKRTHKIAACTLSKKARYALHCLRERPGSIFEVKLLGDSRYYWLNSQMSPAQWPVPGRVMRDLELAGWVEIYDKGARARLVKS